MAKCNDYKTQIASIKKTNIIITVIHSKANDEDLP